MALPIPVLSKAEKTQAIKEFFYNTKMDAQVNQATIKVDAANITPNVILTAATKVLNINRGKEKTDSRDNLAFSRFLGLEDYMKEYITIDPGKYVAKAKSKMEAKKGLDWLHAGFFTPMTQAIVIGNSLSQNVEGHNPLDYYDVSHKITKMGMGGISSESSIPDESREVNSSQFMFIDPIKTSEALSIGVVGYATQRTRKGADGKLYKLVLDKNKKEVWVDHQTLLRSKIEIPEN